MKHKAKIAGSENDIETEVVMLNIGDVKITFLDAQGNPARRGSGEPLYRHSFTVEGPGIDPLRVKRVMIPPLDYGNPELLMVKVEMYPWNPAEITESDAKLDATPVFVSHGYTVLEDGRLRCHECGGLGLPPANPDGSIAEGATGTLESIDHVLGCKQGGLSEVQINDHIYTMTPDFMILCKHCGARAKFNESEKIQHKPDCPHYGKGY